MAEFGPAFETMMRNEGGFVLHTVPGDRGGMTYAGIARNFHPNWPGWRLLDQNPDSPALTGLVRDFYRAHYWQRVQGDAIKSQAIATNLFDFGVNAGIRTAVKLAQIVVGATPDGAIGPKTVQALNEYDEALFVAHYAIAKMKRYAQIVTRNRSQSKFLLGWLNRTIRSAA